MAEAESPPVGHEFKGQGLSLTPRKVAIGYSVGAGILMAYLALLNSTHTQSPMDDGYVLALAWRVIHGEIPHRDFIYVRPALTPLLHTLWFLFPERLQFQAARLGYHVWMGAVFLLPPWAVIWRSRLDVWQVFAVFSTSFMGWIFANSCFQPMPWYTVDGVLFSTLSLVAFQFAGRSRSRVGVWLCLGGAMSSCALLAKQNFALMAPAFGIAAAFLIRSRLQEFRQRFRAGLLVATGLLLPLLLLLTYLAGNSALQECWFQIHSYTDPGAAYGFGYGAYVPESTWDAAAVCFFALLGGLVGGGAPLGTSWGVLERVARILAFPLFFASLAQGVPLLGNGLPYSRTMLLRFAAFLLANFARKALSRRSQETKKASEWDGTGWFCSGAILTAWSSSISYGYTVPNLGYAPVGCALAYVLVQSEFKPFLRRGLTVWMGLILAFTYRQLVLQDEAQVGAGFQKGDPHSDLSLLYPKFGPTLTTHPLTFERYQNLKGLSEALGRKFASRPTVVYPEFPLYYFLSGRRNPMAVDWWYPNEIEVRRDRLKERFLAIKPIVFLEVNPGRAGCEEPKYDGPLTDRGHWIIAHGRLLQKQGTFCAYEIL